jgi:hypothetical protein
MYKQTHKQFHRQSQGWMGWTTGYTRETSIPDARPRTANHLARRNHPSAQHSTHAAKRHSYNPTDQFLTARDLVFHPFMDFYIFHREPVGLLGFFVDLFFFRCNQVSVAFGFIFGTYIYSELGCVGIDTFPRIRSNASSRGQEGGFSVLGVRVVFLDLYFISLNFGFIWGLVFLCKLVGVVRIFGLVIFRGIQYRGLVFYSEFGCVPLYIYWYLLYLFPLYFTHRFIHYLLITCPFILQLLVTVLSIVWTLVRWILNP